MALYVGSVDFVATGVGGAGRELLGAFMLDVLGAFMLDVLDAFTGCGTDGIFDATLLA